MRIVGNSIISFYKLPLFQREVSFQIFRTLVHIFLIQNVMFENLLPAIPIQCHILHSSLFCQVLEVQQNFLNIYQDSTVTLTSCSLVSNESSQSTGGGIGKRSMEKTLNPKMFLN